MTLIWKAYYLGEAAIINHHGLVASTIEMCFLTVPEAGELRSGPVNSEIVLIGLEAAFPPMALPL